MLILHEATSYSKLTAAIQHSALTHKYKDVKVVESGSFKNNDSRKMYFARMLFRGHKDTIETLEVLSTDKNFGAIDGVVVYKGSEPVKTAYFKQSVQIAEFIQNIAGGTSLGESAMILGSLNTLLSLFMVVMSLFFTGKWVIDKFVASRDEHRAKVDAEERLNQFLFKGQTGSEAAFDSYKTIVSYIHNLINGKSHGVVLYGIPGTGKTYIIRRTLHFAGLTPEKDYVIVKGSSASAEQNIKIIYSTLHKYNGKLIVFDDFDSALSDINTINLLKAALDSYPVRIISMPDLGQYNQNDAPLPSKFEFTGKIIMVTNMKDVDTAIKSRTQAVALNFTSKEFEHNIGKMLEFVNPEIRIALKKEVYEFLTDCVAENPDVTIDFRRFSSMVDLRIAYPDEWRGLCKEMLYPRS